MIDKSVGSNINLSIDVPVMNKKNVQEFITEVNNINNKYIGQKKNSDMIYQLKYDLEALLQNDKYTGITVKNNEFFTEELWSLEKLLEIYNKEYPNRFDRKEEYTNIEVNNMLFELNIKGIIGDYHSPAVCADLPSHNNKIFIDEYIFLQVPIIQL